MTKRKSSSGIPVPDEEDASHNNDKQHLEMERKRDKEKKRRLEISCSVNRLTKTIDSVIPDILNKALVGDDEGHAGTTRRPTSQGARSRSSPRQEEASNEPVESIGAGHASTPTQSSNPNRSLNRTDVINTACDVIDLLNEEVLLLRADKARRHPQDAKPSAGGDGAGTQQVIASTSAMTWTRPIESRSNIEVADGDLFNTSQHDVSSGSNHASADATMALLFLQQQQQLQCQRGPGAVRPTHSSSSSFEARLLQQRAADASHLQQVRTRNALSLQPHEELLQQLRQQQQQQQHEQDLPQQLRHQQQQQQQQLQEDLLQRQEESSRMHRVSYRPGYEGKGRMPLVQPGIPAFAAARVENPGGLASLVVPSGTTPAMASFGGISATGVPLSQYSLYERYLQQQGQHGQNPH